MTQINTDLFVDNLRNLRNPRENILYPQINTDLFVVNLRNHSVVVEKT